MRGQPECLGTDPLRILWGFKEELSCFEELCQLYLNFTLFSKIIMKIYTIRDPYLFWFEQHLKDDLV